MPPIQASTEPRARARRTWPVPLAVVLLGLAVTAVAAGATAGAVNDDRGAELDRLSEQARTAIERRIASASEILYGLRGSLAVDETFDQHDFSAFVRLNGGLRRLPGLSGAAFDRLVRPAQLAAYERSIRTAGRPGFAVFPRPGAVKDLFVVEYIEPLAGNEVGLGFDIGSEAHRRAAVEEARDSGDLIASSPISTLKKEPRSTNLAFVLVLAVYDSPGVPVTAPARRRHFKGVFTLGQRSDALLQGLLAVDSPIQIEEIYDAGPTVDSQPQRLSADRLLVDTNPKISALRPETLRAPYRLLDVNVGSRRWRMLVTARPGEISGSAGILPWVVSATGAALSLALAGLVLSFARSRHVALELAEEMTAGLREREGDLEQANRRLASANTAMREFIGVASHDMRSPLATIIGLSKTLLDHWEDGNDKTRRDAFEVIERRADQLTRLVNDLLVSSEIEGGTLRPRTEPVDTGIAIRDCVGWLDPEEGSAVAVNAAPGVIAKTDRSHLMRILTNLVDNAFKYGAAPVRVDANVNGPWVQIRVGDSGAGVDAEFAPRLFEKFARAPQTARKDGTGLGLSIVRGLARANGGDAWFDPNGDGGATFVVRLPAAT